MITLTDMMYDLYEIGYPWDYLCEISDGELVDIWEEEFPFFDPIAY